MMDRRLSKVGSERKGLRSRLRDWVLTTLCLKSPFQHFDLPNRSLIHDERESSCYSMLKLWRSIVR